MNTDGIRAQCDASRADAKGDRLVVLTDTTVRALCDAADEVERLRTAVGIARVEGCTTHLAEWRLMRVERDGALAARSALDAKLRDLCETQWCHHECFTAARVAALLDRAAARGLTDA